MWGVVQHFSSHCRIFGRQGEVSEGRHIAPRNVVGQHTQGLHAVVCGFTMAGRQGLGRWLPPVQPLPPLPGGGSGGVLLLCSRRALLIVRDENGGSRSVGQRCQERLGQKVFSTGVPR